MNVMTKFHIVYVADRRDPYYYTNWEGKAHAEIIAESVDDARDRLKKILPELRSTHFWNMRVLKITDEPVFPNAADEMESQQSEVRA